MYMPKRYWHFADQQLAIENTGNLINVGADNLLERNFKAVHYSSP
jgi:hypothetical protein